jgi:hypothetical protein
MKMRDNATLCRATDAANPAAWFLLCPSSQRIGVAPRARSYGRTKTSLDSLVRNLTRPAAQIQPALSARMLA